VILMAPLQRPGRAWRSRPRLVISSSRRPLSYRLAGAFHSVGDLGQTAELLRRNVETLTLDPPGRVRELAISSRAWLGRVLSERGEFLEGRRHGEEALRLAMEEGRGYIQLIAYGSLGKLYLNKGELASLSRGPI
jgi:hypothetical protein